jgi:hypothetical protein
MNSVFEDSINRGIWIIAMCCFQKIRIIPYNTFLIRKNNDVASAVYNIDNTS